MTLVNLDVYARLRGSLEAAEQSALWKEATASALEIYCETTHAVEALRRAPFSDSVEDGLAALRLLRERLACYRIAVQNERLALAWRELNAIGEILDGMALLGERMRREGLAA
jgi:hypothetical protein